LVLAGVLAGFFLVPLPVSRIRDKGLVQIREDAVVPVHISESGILQRLAVYDGQFIKAGTVIAEFSNPRLSEELMLSEAQAKIYAERAVNLQGNPPPDTVESQNSRSQWSANLTQATSEAERHRRLSRYYRDQLQALQTVKAPRDGTVLGLPKKDEFLKLWDKTEQRPICSIGDPTKLRILVPVGPEDFDLLQENLAQKKEIEVSVYISGRSDRIVTGRITKLPESPAKEVPLGLTSRGGGNLAIKPATNPNQLEPLVQTYLVSIEVLDADAAVRPGTLAAVKIHLPWKSAAWWAWRGIATALDIGLLR
jgi:putative peptide zinc metalloprotease protein